MATRRNESYKRKSFDTFRNEDLKKSKSKKRFKEYSEPRTPPLPTSMSTMEELIKQRETLHKKLNKITRSYDDGSRNNHKSQTSDNESVKHSDGSCKKRNCECLAFDWTSESKKQLNTLDDSLYHLDENSEDEENIIEIRRRQRKQLLEKFKSTHTEVPVDKVVHNIIASHINAINDKEDIELVVKSSENKILTDMFADIDDFTPIKLPEGVTKDNNNDNPQLNGNWDNVDGYYNIRIGDVLNNDRYTIKDTCGQGVFANVVRAQDHKQGNAEVAIKITRNNDLMKMTASKEIAFLKEVNDADPGDKYHCVRLLRHFVHKTHMCLVLEPLHIDMRCLIKKYGRHGLNLKAVSSYSRQLLLALKHLKNLGIIHADVKPDNILVNENKNILKLCDFGSAGRIRQEEPTPYLVSRFYRAPEIILGLTCGHGVDMWSAACTIYEMAVGKILFTGSSNNKMLKCFMDLKGKIPNKLAKKGKFKDQHFNYNYSFLLHKTDLATGREKVVELNNIKITRNLTRELRMSITSEKKSIQLKDLLDKMLVLDPIMRIGATDALKHIFVKGEVEKYL